MSLVHGFLAAITFSLVCIFYYTMKISDNIQLMREMMQEDRKWLR